MITKKIRIFLAKNAIETLLTIAAFAIAFVLIPMYFEEDALNVYLNGVFSANQAILVERIPEIRKQIEQETIKHPKYANFNQKSIHLNAVNDTANAFIDDLLLEITKNGSIATIQLEKARETSEKLRKILATAIKAEDKAIIKERLLTFNAPIPPQLTPLQQKGILLVLKGINMENSIFVQNYISDHLHSCMDCEAVEKFTFLFTPNKVFFKNGETMTGKSAIIHYLDPVNRIAYRINNQLYQPKSDIVQYKETPKRVGLQKLVVAVSIKNPLTSAESALRDTFYYEVVP